MSYIGHGLSHAIFGGFAASALLGVNFLLGAGAWGIASALMVNTVTRRRVIGSDAAIGVITTASFALGLALFALFGRQGTNFDAALFGSILGVGTDDVIAIVVVSLVAGALIFLRYRALLFTTFDPEVADVAGVNTARIDAMLTVVLACSILATMQVLGVTLIAAVLVIPAAIARMLTNSFARMLQLAAAIGAVCGFVGMNLSYHLDIQSGPAIVLVAATIFALVFVTTGITGRRRAAGLVAAAGRSALARALLARSAGRARRSGSARSAPRSPTARAPASRDAVQRRRIDGLQRAAGLAGEVLAVAEADEDVAPGAVAGMEVADEAELAERLEVAVDRGDVRLRHAAAEAVGDVLGRDRLARREQRLEHEPSRGGQAQAAAPHDLDRLIEVGDDHGLAVRRDGHRP